MTRRPHRHRRLAAALAVLGALLLAACGEEDAPPRPAAEPPASRPADFPQPEGRSLQELQRAVPEGPVLAPSMSRLETGASRFSFALFDVARNPLPGAEVALYVADSPTGEARGPIPVRSESLDVRGQFRSRTTAADPDSAESVYVAEPRLRRPGRAYVVALARLDGRLVSAGPVTIPVVRPGAGRGGPPSVGEPAPRISTPTVEDAGGDLSTIDTRIPTYPPLHEEDVADVLGEKPLVLLFATPQLCRSRVCAPVVDVAAQVQQDYGDRVAFVHMEIYEDNRIDNGVRPQVRQYGLPSEPWLFVIDREGRVSTRIEGAFSPRELERAVARVAA